MPERHHNAELARLDWLANRMDSAFRVPGTQFRIGFDALVGLVPGIGDALTIAPALYIMWKSREMGVRGPRLLRMGGNVALDTLIGAIPLVGDLFDAGFKANRRNVALLRDHLERSAAPAIYEKGPRNGTARINRFASAAI